MHKKLVLCLGSGGIRGFAHIGVLKALEQHNISIDAYYGTSVGSLVSVLSASGLSAKILEGLALKLKPMDIIDLTVPNNGYIKGHKLNKFVQKHLNDKKFFSDIDKMVKVTATNTKSGQLKIFHQGLISAAVQASCAIPNVFRPVMIDGVEYLDGDLKSPVPVLIARKDHPEAVILAVNVIAFIDQAPRKNKKWAQRIAKDIYRRTIVDFEKPEADIFLDLDIGYFKKPVYKWAEHQIEVGYNSTLACIDKIQQRLKSL